jgi:tRNA (uracil-5-)-methyltransferase
LIADFTGAFFQNNNVILSDFTGYAHNQLITTFDSLRVAERFLVDAYCGSGLFSITCSEGFKSVIGVEISSDSVKYAIRNAKTNGIENASFLTGSADKIFDVVKTPPDQTALIIDPPRKVTNRDWFFELSKQGCDKVFLDQLVKFNPRVIIYVSCNVHTQARDIAVLLNEEQTEYKIAGIRGFDLFPQTHHVESITTLVRYQEISN